MGETSVRRRVAWFVGGTVAAVALVAAGAVAVRISPGSAPLVVARDDDGVATVLVSGDSLAGAFFASTPEQGFVNLVSDALGPVQITEAAQAHQTLTTVAAITDVPSDVDVAIIELGTNDVGEQTPLDDFDAQYGALLDRIRASSPDAAIVCLGTWTGWGGDYDRAIESACVDHEGRYVPLGGLFRDAANRGPEGRPTFLGTGDDFHPNDLGHRAIANAILAVLKR
ncbi:lysophospholipase L1 [Microbacterium testaceum StLB037]|uniref:Lysophospholipase L1 n=1 Tax=Microbacterium testaceum (strain StLB037) TaxID=979556 RepID=E8N8Q7_MICTS|nr:SGNH/GDSL hydrolase family protein [Microbacterium testaceum]BAJ75713.1 lysophospholipase L1 [Microbacterium testaceum StLB037]